MLTVMELLSFPLFRNFSLVSGYGGLYNQVSGTGIFEWESSFEVEKNFDQGEFVMSTLSLARSDAALAESSIRMLIEKRVSAIAIKDIYFHTISDELKAYSDHCRVPIFFFSDTFFDDIIFTIKNTLLTQRRDFNHVEQVEYLLDPARSADQKKRKARELNPFFHSCVICGFCSLKQGIPLQKSLKAPVLNPEDSVYSVLAYQQGILVIYTVEEHEFSVLEDRLSDFLSRSELRKNATRIGISSPTKGLETLGTAIQESLHAHASCRLNRSEMLRFQDSGLDQILLPSVNTHWMRRYYENQLTKLTDYDSRHGSKLMETLFSYVEHNGDIKQTAQNMFQHGNTIRYRMEKIRSLLNLAENDAAFAQLYVFVRMHQIYGDSKDV